MNVSWYCCMPFPLKASQAPQGLTQHGPFGRSIPPGSCLAIGFLKQNLPHTPAVARQLNAEMAGPVVAGAGQPGLGWGAGLCPKAEWGTGCPLLFLTCVSVFQPVVLGNFRPMSLRRRPGQVSLHSAVAARGGQEVSSGRKRSSKRRNILMFSCEWVGAAGKLEWAPADAGKGL